MRPLAGLLVALLVAAPAAAQTPPCEASISGKIGEVFVSVETGGTLVSWAVEPRAGVGEESDHFARPGLVLDFRPGRSGALELAALSTSVTRYEDAATGRAPAMSRVRVVAKPEAGAEVAWAATNATRGEGELAKQLKANWPGALTLSVQFDGKTVAEAEFDLATRAEAERMGREALGKCGG